jgi:Flp pilus assembly protein TadG
MVTAELAAALPVLVVVLAATMSAVAVVGARIRLQDAARDLARAAARNDVATGRTLAARDAPAATLTLDRDGSDVVAVAVQQVHPLGGWLPAVHQSERAVAVLEPGSTAPP